MPLVIHVCIVLLDVVGLVGSSFAGSHPIVTQPKTEGIDTNSLMQMNVVAKISRVEGNTSIEGFLGLGTGASAAVFEPKIVAFASSRTKLRAGLQPAHSGHVIPSSAATYAGTVLSIGASSANSPSTLTSFCPDTHYFDDVLLVIHFNQAPRQGVLPFLLKWYSPCFRNVAVVAPTDHLEGEPQIPRILCNDKGYWVQKCYSRAMEQLPGYRGYLIMNDDTIFKPQRLMSYDKDLWWNYGCNGLCNYTLATPMAVQFDSMSNMPQPNQTCAKEFIDVPGPPYCTSRRGPLCGGHSSTFYFDGAILWWNTTASEQMKQKYIAYTGGTQVPVGCQADFIYVPRRMVSLYAQLAKEMPGVQLEVFQPMLNMVWRALGGAEVTIPVQEFYYDWGLQAAQRGSQESLRQHSGVAMFHPLKLSMQNVRMFVSRWLQDSSF